MRPLVLLPLLLAMACGDDSETSQGAGSTGDASSGSSTAAAGSSSSQASSGAATSGSSSVAASTSGAGGDGGGGQGGDGGAGGDDPGAGGVLGFGGSGGAPECTDALCPEFGVQCDPACGSGCEAFACDDGEETYLLGFGRLGVSIPPIEEAHPDCAIDCPEALFTVKLSLNTGDSGHGGCLAWSTPYGVRVEIVKTEDGEPPPACPTLAATKCDEGHTYAADEQSFALVSVIDPAGFGRVVNLDHRVDDCDEVVPLDCEGAGCNGTENGP